MRGLLAFSRVIDAINAFIGRSASWMILAAVLVSAINAIVRKLFNESSNGWLELQWYLFGAAFMGAAAYTLRTNEHIRIDILYARWSRRTQNWVDLIGHLLFLLPFTVVMMYFLFPWAFAAYRSGEMSPNSGGLILWPARMIILLGFVMLFLQALSELIKKIAVITGVIDDPTPFVSTHDAVENEAIETARGMQSALDNTPSSNPEQRRT